MRVLLVMFVLCGCGSAPLRPTVSATCALPGDPEVLFEEGDARLLVWETVLPKVWSQEVRPASEAVDVYLRAIRDANGAVRRPVADAPDIPNERMREVWRREHINEEIAFSGESGTVRPARCFESMFFAYQAQRYSQLTAPTEFIVVLVGKKEGSKMRVRAYYGASSSMFPPKTVYPIARAAQDVARGWRMLTMLHNHTVRTYKGEPALGPPAPSTSDVEFARGLVDSYGLESILVTNGLYTIEVSAAELSRYEARE